MAQEVDARTDVFAVGIILWELLSGKRLFLGETDFQTVKKVQAAAIPDIAVLNTRVPPELARIITRSLARDPAQRYPTARALGMELSKFLFKFGVAVSTFDIGTLVQGAMKERQRYRPQQASIIDKLIEEALLEFTSLTDDKAPLHPSRPIPLPPLMGRDQAPGAGNYLSSWIDEIAVGTKLENSLLHASLPPGLAVGNLAALEDEPLTIPAPAPSSRAGASIPAARSSASPLAPTATTTSAPPPPMSSLWPPAQKSNPQTKVGVVVALVVVMAAGAAAWFSHLIPHP
jgi:eukaryotic-like serine/threonine-protein kinase